MLTQAQGNGRIMVGMEGGELGIPIKVSHQPLPPGMGGRILPKTITAPRPLLLRPVPSTVKVSWEVSQHLTATRPRDKTKGSMPHF